MRCHRRAAESDWRPGFPRGRYTLFKEEVGEGNVQAIDSRGETLSGPGHSSVGERTECGSERAAVVDAQAGYRVHDDTPELRRSGPGSIPHRAQGRDQRQTDHDEAGACAGFGELSPLTDLRTPHNWSSQDSVETLSARLVSRFELRWTHPAEMTVAPHSIVEGIDVVGHIGDRQLSALVDLFLDPLFLQAAEEGLGDGIVPAVAFRLILGSRRFERQNRRHASLPYWVP